MCSATPILQYSFPVSSALFSPDAHSFLKIFSSPSTSAHIKWAGHNKCQANTSLLGFQTQQGAAVKYPPCPNMGEQSKGITHSVWGLHIHDLQLVQARIVLPLWKTEGAEASGQRPFPLHSRKANQSHTPLAEQQQQHGPTPEALLSSVYDPLQRYSEHGSLILYQRRCYSMEGCLKICFYSPHFNMQPADTVHTADVFLHDWRCNSRH